MTSINLIPMISMPRILSCASWIRSFRSEEHCLKLYVAKPRRQVEGVVHCCCAVRVVIVGGGGVGMAAASERNIAKMEKGMSVLRDRNMAS